MEKRSLLSEYRTEGRTLHGWAAVFNSPTQIFENGRQFTEVVKPGAFRNALASGGDIIATFNHDVNFLLGRTSNGSLRLAEDNKGLRFELDLPDTTAGRDVKALVEAGTLRGASFTFNVRQGGERWNGKTRELTDLYLAELGPVAMPAYPATEVGVRSKIPFLRMKLRMVEATY